jgi:hypothetical protein
MEGQRTVSDHTAPRDVDETGDATNDTISRVALIALMYYPEIQVDEPDFSLSGEVAWALEPLTTLTDAQRAELTDLIGRTVIDPTTHREELLAALYAITPDRSR